MRILVLELSEVFLSIERSASDNDKGFFVTWIGFDTSPSTCKSGIESAIFKSSWGSLKYFDNLSITDILAHDSFTCMSHQRMRKRYNHLNQPS